MQMTKPLLQLLQIAFFISFLGMYQVVDGFEETKWEEDSNCSQKISEGGQEIDWTRDLSDCQLDNHCAKDRFTLSGELLYFKPGIEQSSYVITSSDNIVSGEFFPSGKRHINSSTYKPGFRVEGLYRPCNECYEIDFRFTYFQAHHSNSTNGDFLFDTIGYPGDGAQSPEDINYTGTARVRDSYRYYAVDATFNRLGLHSCIDNLYLLIGLHYANIEHSTHFTSVGTFPNNGAARPVDNVLRSHSNFWGIGPQLGLDYTYDVTWPEWCIGNLSLKANARAALLCSNSNASFHYRTLRTLGTSGVNLKNGDLWRVSPAVDAKLGGSYHFCLCGLDSDIELGYEWIWYHNSVDSITGLDVAFAGNSTDVFSNLSLHGPFLKINVSF